MPTVASEGAIRRTRSIESEVFQAYKSAKDAYENQGIRGLISSIFPMFSSADREREFIERRDELVSLLKNGSLVAFYRQDDTALKAVIGRRPGEYGLTCVPAIRLYTADKITGMIKNLQDISVFKDLEIITYNAAPRTRRLDRYGTRK